MKPDGHCLHPRSFRPTFLSFYLIFHIRHFPQQFFLMLFVGEQVPLRKSLGDGGVCVDEWSEHRCFGFVLLARFTVFGRALLVN
jgi:hypothetical protein